MTRKRCIRGWSVVVLVVFALQMPGGFTAALVAQQPAPAIRGGGLAGLVPSGDPRVERLVGEEAWNLLEQKVIAKHRKAWEAALKTKEARGWKKTDRIVAFRSRHTTVLTKVQSQAFDIGDALIIEWEWQCDAYSVCGTYYFESYYDGGSIVYDAEFVPTSGWGGYSPWANYIGGNSGQDTRRQRQARNVANVPGIRLASTAGEQRAPGDDYCPGDLWQWTQCMRDCLARKHEAAMAGAAGAAGGLALGCVRAIRPGPLVAVGASFLGCLTLSAGGAILGSFIANHWYSPCDSAGGQCGPNPC
ncbi:MAG: hypothetical protein ACRD09_10245 [Vicinamibacterales bacterium]